MAVQAKQQEEKAKQQEERENAKKAKADKRDSKQPQPTKPPGPVTAGNTKPAAEAAGSDPASPVVGADVAGGKQKVAPSPVVGLESVYSHVSKKEAEQVCAPGWGPGSVLPVSPFGHLRCSGPTVTYTYTFARACTGTCARVCTFFSAACT